jgi:stearoyl-CoA desaturase (delta-9 desaturase)
MTDLLITFYLSYAIVFVITIGYVHRHLAHKTIEYSVAMVIISKTLIWLTSPFKYDIYYGRNWIARHIKHHMNSDTIDDPHSPYFRDATKSIKLPVSEITEILKNTNSQAPVTALDKFFEKYPYGILILTVISLIQFGWLGLLFPIFLGYMVKFVIRYGNHVLHVWPGYKHKSQKDQARNMPWFFWISFGEELHSNHHVNPGSPNLGIRWWEFDVTYLFMKILSWVKLVKINNVDNINNTNLNDIEMVGYGSKQ